MRDLVQKLPSGNPQDHGTSDDTIAAVLATLNEVIKKHPEFSRSLLEAGGVERLMTITRQRSRFSSRVVKFASQVLYSMWVHQELREVYRKAGWKEQDFVTKTIAARNARPNSPTNMNSTLNRPMASQSGTRYEDRTMRRGGGQGQAGNPGGNGAAVGMAGHSDAQGHMGYRVSCSEKKRGILRMCSLIAIGMFCSPRTFRWRTCLCTVAPVIPRRPNKPIILRRTIM